MADNFTFKDASGVNRTARAKDNSSIHLPATVLADELGTLVAADDAAAAGPIFPVAGLYQTTVDQVDAGDVGRARMTYRRSLLASPDADFLVATSSSVVGVGNMTVSDVGATTGYVAPTTDFFDGSDSSFTTAAKHIRIPMMNWSRLSVAVSHTLGVNVTLTLFMTVGSAGSLVQIYNEASLANGTYSFFPFAGGTGAVSSIKTVPALQCPMEYLVIKIQAATDPSGGGVTLLVNRG